MCDDTTEGENQTLLSRRRLGLGLAAAAALAGCGTLGSGPRDGADAGAIEPGSVTPGDPTKALPTKRRTVRFATSDGEADGVFVAPDEGKHPGVLMWPDVAGLRPAYEKMATRLAGSGYAVLVVNPYYRNAKSPILESFDQWRTEEGRAKIKPMREALTSAAIARDGAAFIAWLDQQAEVDTTKKIGTQGYCMSGPFTVRVAAAVPARVGAFASFHGGGLVTDAADSPHRLLDKVAAAGLICIASNDHERDLDAKPALEAAAEAASMSAEIDVYPANHGWCALDSPVYDEAQAERAWSRLLATYAAHL